MAETSRIRATVTLGGSGRVVKRTAATASDTLRGAGTKRSALDRLGTGYNDDSLQFTTLISNNKRKMKVMEEVLSVGTMEDAGIDKYDLRFKLMEKSVSKRVQSGDDRSTVDLREKLSRIAQPPVPARVSPAYGYPYVRQRVPESKDSGLLGRFPHARNLEDLPMISSSKISNNPWTLDHIRRRSPSAVVSGSRDLSPPTRKVAEPDRVPLRRGYDTLEAASYVSRDILDGPRSANSSKPFISSSALPDIPSKPTVSEITHFSSPSGSVQKRSYMGDEYQTVEGLLNSLGLEKYAVIFKAEEVDLSALKQMRDSDLKELGIRMGHTTDETLVARLVCQSASDVEKGSVQFPFTAQLWHELNAEPAYFRKKFTIP